MNLFDAAICALDSLRLHVLRSVLTMLGTVIGVASVVAMVAVGGGARDQVLAQVRALGANNLTVLPGSVTQAGVRLGAGAAPTLTDEDAASIVREIPEVELVASFKFAGFMPAVAPGSNWSTVIFGAHNGWDKASSWRVDRGRPFDHRELHEGLQVAILGETVARRLFSDTDPIDQIVRIRHIPLRVVGLLEPKGQSPTGQDRDDLILVPLNTARARVVGGALAKPDAISWIGIRVRDGESLEEVRRSARALLRQRHALEAQQADDFTIRDRTELIEAREGSARTLALMLASIAGVSLAVGGIGIMNIMLASVTERTNEIGVRLAVGARRRDIRRQFLFEAIGLALGGGIVGALLGIAASYGLSSWGGWPALVEPLSVILAVMGASLVGLASGWYPALRASRLDPIDALGRI
jgi:putative ABC transport system permease protein